MSRKGEGGTLLWIVALLAILALVGVVSVNVPQAQSLFGQQTTTTAPEAAAFATSTVKVGGFDPLNANLSVDVNAELWSDDGQQSVGETQINTSPASLTTSGPTTFSGYVMMGNDNYVSATDRGVEHYYRKYPISWVKQGEITKTHIPQYKEGTPSWTGYDDGTTEATLNVSVSTSIVDTTELRFQTSAGACVGNPQLANPLANCFNATSIATWDSIRPLNYVGTIPSPSFLSGYNVVGGVCYVLPVSAVCDSTTASNDYRYFIRLDPATEPTEVTSPAHSILLDKTYYKDDNGVWQIGWEDSSNLVADTDIGFQAMGNTKVINFT